MKNKLTGILFSLVIFIAMISCKVGLGEIVDLVAPEITVEEMVAYNTDGSIADTVKEFGTAVYTKKNVTFSGKATDNVEVTKVYAEIKWNDSDYTYLKTADISGEKWTLDISFEKEGACWLKIVACDKNENYGTKANKVVTLFVDETAPKADDWYIDRQINGIQYKLKSLQDLKNILEEDKNLSNPSNKDVAQNGDFLICASFDDAAGIKSGTTSISIYDENGNKVVSGIEVDSSSTSDYAPKFKIDGEIHNLAKTGKNYYQVRYSSSDIIPDSNSVKDIEVSLGWFLWWPESDMPRCSITDLEENASSMSIRTGDSLNITVFDDDALKGDITCKLKGDNPSNDVTETKTITSDTERECNIIVKAPDKPQTMTLEITAEDKNGKQLNTRFTVYVTDEFKPSVIFTSPENNQIPAVNGNEANITFAGIALDKVVCNFLEIIWVPDSVTIDATAKRTLAQNWFNSIDYSKKTHVTDEKDYEFEEGTGDYAGLKKWSAKLTSSGTEGSFNKYDFKFDIPLLGDNSVLKSEATKDKNFFARVIRSNDIYSESELKLTGDNLVPEIKAISPAGNMAYIDGDLDLVIKFKGEKQSGLPMNIAKYALYKDGNLVNGSYDTKGECYTYTVPKATLDEYVQNNNNPKFTYYVEDVLGNSASAEYQFIIDTLPVIQTVTSSASAKCKKGDEIYINVSFSKPITCSDDVKLKLRNIKNAVNDGNTTVYADYSSGSGSTTLIFKYTVKEGDTSKELQVFNETGVGPIKGIDESVAHLAQLSTANNLQAKRAGNPITIDGVTPNVKSIEISTDSGTENKNNNISYLKAGRTVTATVITDKKVSVQGSPVIDLYNDANNKKITLNWQGIADEGTGSKLTFTKKVTSDDEGLYNKNYNFVNSDVIKDSYENSISVGSVTATGETFIVDTTAPGKPKIKNADGTAELASGKYMTDVTFSISTDANDAKGVAETSISKIEYSLTGGSTWEKNPYKSPVTVSSDANLVARVTDYAGNISAYSDVVNLEITNKFPTFTVECTNSDGNYKAGDTITFRVYFKREVNIDSNSTASISLSKNADAETITSGAKATITATSKGKNSVTSADFTYVVQKTDEFTLKIGRNDLDLSGITDLYGFTQAGAKLTADFSREADYSRENVKCDGVPPKVTRMKPSGEKTIQNGLNAYEFPSTSITLTFSEPVTAVNGNIYLRQTAGWAIPPMFTADEFETVKIAVNNATIDTSKTNTLSGSQVLYMDGLEDAENLYNSLVGAAHDRYHGTAQYVGPYKKMTNGIKDNGDPDLDVKYVLDFGVDIWDSAKSTKKNFGKTFEPNYRKKNASGNYIGDNEYNTYHHKYYAGWVNVLTGSDINPHEITTDTIRYVLEQAHYHERYMAVNSSYVTISDDGTTVTLNFPNDIFGNTNLPAGREWELVIEEGTFMDASGNKFGYDYSGNTLQKTTGDIVQIANNGTTEGEWKRKRETADKPLVLIQDGNNAAFMSAGVATPVIRVDRYSYGLGIYQPTGTISDGVVETQMINSETNGTYVASLDSYLQTGSTAPTAKVAVKIDCETKNATIKYARKTAETNTCVNTETQPERTNGSSVVTKSSSIQLAVPTSNTDASDNDHKGEGNSNGATRAIFLGGNGDYTKAYREYIYADATVGEISSAPAKEGIFQTVVCINHPLHNKAYSRTSDDVYTFGAGQQVVNIHGYTTKSITPYPLRDQLVASAYMRQTYQAPSPNNFNYYWISYETLTDATFSMYVYGQNAYWVYHNYGTYNSLNWGDWSKDYGVFKAGEYTLCTGMESYVSTRYDSDKKYNSAGEETDENSKKLSEWRKD